MHASNVESLFREQYSGAALSVSYMSVGIASSGVGFYLSSGLATLLPSDVMLISLISGVMGMMLMTIVSAAIHSAVRVLFVCYAENPFILKKNHPALYKHFVKEEPTAEQA